MERDEERTRVIAESFAPLAQLVERRVEAVQLRLDAAKLDEHLIERLRRAVGAHRGEIPLFFEVARPGAYRLIARAESTMRVAPSGEFVEAVETLLGPDRIRYRAKTDV